MDSMLDILASGIHDTKNQLFLAESLVAAAENSHGIDLSEARYALEAAATRLSRTLSAYRLLRQQCTLSPIPVVVSDLCEEVALSQRIHLARAGIGLDIDCQVDDAWLLDRDLLTDMLNNAVQNAARFARNRIRLTAGQDDDGLWLRVEDDGPGFATLPPRFGTGLLLAERLAALHVRKGRCGRLHLDNGGTLGGACFELHLP